jgi:hypothetical protein
MYGIDPALIRATAGGTENRGLLLENVAFLELMRRRKIVHYYADPHGKHEVDFVSRDSETKAVELIQVCADLSRAETQARELRGLHQAAKAFRKQTDENLLRLTTSPVMMPLDLSSTFDPATTARPARWMPAATTPPTKAAAKLALSSWTSSEEGSAPGEPDFPSFVASFVLSFVEKHDESWMRTDKARDKA